MVITPARYGDHSMNIFTRYGSRGIDSVLVVMHITLHVYGDRYMYMEIVTCIWRSLHVYGDRYMYMEIVTCI